VIHLKRFQNNYTKITIPVTYPLHDLDLSPYQLSEDKYANPPKYDLFAVSVHSGGLGGGHYTAYALNPMQNKWYYFDDSRVSPSTPSVHYNLPGAYVLFYKRQDDTRYEKITLLK